MKIQDRLKHAWNVFSNSRDPTYPRTLEYGSYSANGRPYRSTTLINGKSLITSIYNRLSIDVSLMTIRHVKVDDNENFKSLMASNLNDCLTIEANIDQAASNFLMDITQSLFDEGVIAVVPIDTDINPNTGSFDILSMRTAKILEWYPRHVKVEAYNDTTARFETLICDKRRVAIIENPFYSIMNEGNSTLKRLASKMSLLDTIDAQSASGKLDIIIQLPYTVRSDIRKNQAEARAKDIEVQLTGSKYGIAYIDATEKVTQLNRPVENNLLEQINALTDKLLAELGLTMEILNGSANEEAMLNYYSRTIEPILKTITESFSRSFLTKTARTQKQRIKYFREPFKLVPVSKLADIADKFTRNEILTSNEVRGIIGFKPSDDPKANELRNKNINQPEAQGGKLNEI